MLDPLFTALRTIVNRHDPIGITYGHVNIDEYDAEIGQILSILSKVGSEHELVQKIYEIFVKAFDESSAGERSKYDQIAKDVWKLKTMIDGSRHIPELRSKPLVALSAGDVARLRKELVAQAIRIGEDYNARLDFTQDSIKEVDRILEDIHQNFAKTASEDELFNIALPFGCYILELFGRQKIEGNFSVETAFNPGGDLAFTFKGSNTVFPVGWCFKRVADGDIDNLWMKYRFFALKDLPTRTVSPSKKSWFKKLFSK